MTLCVLQHLQHLQRCGMWFSLWHGVFCFSEQEDNKYNVSCRIASRFIRVRVYRIVPYGSIDLSCGNAGRWEEALQLINKLEALAMDGGGVPMSTTLYNFAIDTVSLVLLSLIQYSKRDGETQEF